MLTLTLILGLVTLILGLLTLILGLGATSIEKSLKSSASGRNFLDPSPPYSKKARTDENVGILYLIVIVKFVFFKISPKTFLAHFHHH